jgi:hypothetical protein
MTSRRLVVLVALSVLTTLAGCEEKQCTLMGCGNAIKIDVRDAGGAMQTSFTGELTLDGVAFTITCPWSLPGDQTATVKGHAVWAVCDEQGGGFYVGDVADRGYAFSAQLTGPAGAFSGTLTVNLTTVRDFNGKGCGDCTSGTTTVILQ